MAFKIIRDDIVNVYADAIVNSANEKPVYAGIREEALYETAGKEKLLKERKKIGNIKEGDAKSTPAFSLHAKYIIHTVGPKWIDGSKKEAEILRSCYRNSLRVADELECKSIAFPFIATGVYGFPKSEALNIAISEFSSFLISHEMEIILVVFDNESFELSGKVFKDIDSYISDNYVEEKHIENAVIGNAYGRIGNADNRKSRLFRDRKTDRIKGGLPKEETPDKYELPVELMKKSIESTEETGLDLNQKQVGSMVAATSKESLDDFMKKITATWQESLFQFIDEKGYDEVEVYKRANIDRKLFSKIRSNKNYQPKKITAVAFALALKLNSDETRDFLQRAGFALSPSSKFDLIIQYFIKQEVYDIYLINLALFEHEQPTLGC